MLSQAQIPSKGSGIGQFRVDMPKTKEEAMTWKRTFRVIDPNDPWYYNQHRFQLRGQWFYLYCLGSPADGWRGHEDEFALTPEGTAECESIMIPGVGQPLHSMDDGGECYFNMLVWEWDSNMLKVLGGRANGTMHRSLLGVYDALHAAGKSLTDYDIYVSGAASGGAAWQFNAMVLPESRDLSSVASEIQAQYQQPEDPEEPWVMQAYNPMMTKEQIVQQLQKKLSGGNAMPAGMGAQVNIPAQTGTVVPNTQFNAGFNPPLGQQPAADSDFNVPGVTPGTVQPLAVDQHPSQSVPSPQAPAQQEQAPAAVPSLLAGILPQQ